MDGLELLYPALAHVRPSLADLDTLAAPFEVAAGTVLFHQQSPCRGFPLVIEGEIKVSRSSGEGRSLELYRVVPGELCLVSSASLFRSQVLSAEGVTTKASVLRLISPTTFQQWLDFPAFRDSVLGLFAERMSDLTSLIDAVAFHKLDHRLAAALLGHGSHVETTHQALADELGTVREIVTRLLRRFDREGWVKLGREEIQITNVAALRQLASTLPG